MGHTHSVHFDQNIIRAANWLERFFLQDAEELGLEGNIHFPDFIEKKNPSVGGASRAIPALTVLVLLAIVAAIAAFMTYSRSADNGEQYRQRAAEQQVVFDFYFDDPEKIASALYWVRSLMNPLTAAPYDYAPEDLELKVVIHGTEIVTLAKHNYGKYRDSVERMRYYASLGVRFKVCGLAANDYDYDTDTFYDFVEVVPSAMAEIADLQQRGYGLVVPQIHDKRFSTHEIR